MNKVSNSIKLPEPFVHMFVTKCIESCEEHKVNISNYKISAKTTASIKVCETSVIIHKIIDQE